MTRWVGSFFIRPSVRLFVVSVYTLAGLFALARYFAWFACPLVRALDRCVSWIFVLASSLADLFVAYSFLRCTLPWPHRSCLLLLFVGVVTCVFGCAWVGSAAAGPAAATGKKEKHHAKAEKAEPTEKTEKSTVQGTRTKHPYETRLVGQRTNTIML